MSNNMVEAGANNNNVSLLLELAKKKYGILNKAERKFFRGVAKGESVDFRSAPENDNENNNPANAKDWGEERIIKADRIVWLCTDPTASALVTYRGIEIWQARIDGKFDLEFARISFPLRIIACAFKEEIRLLHANIHSLYLNGSHTGSILAHGLKVEGHVRLCDKFKAEGPVCLISAKIGGNLECDESQFINETGRAITAEGLAVKGNIFFRNGFTAKGEVSLRGAIIGGGLDCTKGTFLNNRATAFKANKINVKLDVLMQKGFRAEGEVDLAGGTIGGNLNCEGGKFINPNKTALMCDSLQVQGGVFLKNKFTSKGEVRFNGAKIGVSLECDDSSFINSNGKALNCDGIKIDGYIFLHNGFYAEGEVDLRSATIGRSLECENGQFINIGAIALIAQDAKVGLNVHLNNGFKAKGKVHLIGIIISGNLDCTNGSFYNPGYEEAILADGMEVKSAVFFRNNFKVNGKVRLVGAIIDRYFIWSDIASCNDLVLDIRSAKIGTLWDNENSWPEDGKLLLNGFVYSEIHEESPRDVRKRIEWLHRQSKEFFLPQPYEQLAKVLREAGHDDDAKRILIEKNRDRVRLGSKLTIAEWLWYRLLGRMIGYGYRPLQAIWGILAVIVVGTVVFGITDGKHMMVPIKDGLDYTKRCYELPDGYPKFNAIVYSIDMFIPLIDLHQAKYWLPNIESKGKLGISEKYSIPISGKVLFDYLYFHIFLGWVFTTLFVVGLTGLVKT